MNAHDVIRKPLITEKSTLGREEGNLATFAVDPKANKHEIRRAVEELFEVEVVTVRTMRQPRKTRRMRPMRPRCSMLLSRKTMRRNLMAFQRRRMSPRVIAMTSEPARTTTAPRTATASLPWRTGPALSITFATNRAAVTLTTTA